MSGIQHVRASKPAKTMYIGEERCEKIRRLAIEVSFHTGQTISASQLLQFLIDEYAAKAVNSLTNSGSFSNENSGTNILSSDS